MWREWAENEGGGVLNRNDLPKETRLFGHYEIMSNNDLCGEVQALRHPKSCPVIHEAWLTMCRLAGRRVNVDPFVISAPLGWNASVALSVETKQPIQKKKAKAELYTLEEVEALKKFAKDHENDNMTQEELWSQAESQQLLVGRTKTSMLKKYAELSRSVYNQTNKHYSKNDEWAICGWAWAWKNLKHIRPDEKRQWELAEEKRVVYGRTAEQLRVKYHKLVKDLGEKEVMRIGEDNFPSLGLGNWGDCFQPTTK